MHACFCVCVGGGGGGMVGCFALLCQHFSVIYIFNNLKSTNNTFFYEAITYHMLDFIMHKHVQKNTKN